jgi:hypothetical protein
MSYKFKPEFCKIATEHLRSGLSISCLGPSLASDDHPLGVSRATVYNWIEEHPEFREAVEAGQQLAQKFYEQRLTAKISGQKINGVNTKDIDTSCLIFALKTRFHKDYGEKQQIDANIRTETLESYLLRTKDQNEQH